MQQFWPQYKNPRHTATRKHSLMRLILPASASLHVCQQHDNDPPQLRSSHPEAHCRGLNPLQMARHAAGSAKASTDSASANLTQVSNLTNAWQLGPANVTQQYGMQILGSGAATGLALDSGSDQASRQIASVGHWHSILLAARLRRQQLCSRLACRQPLQCLCQISYMPASSHFSALCVTQLVVL